MVELRQALRSGRISIEGSHNHRPIEEKLMAPEEWAALKATGPSLLAVPRDVEAYLADRRAMLERRITEGGDRAAAGDLQGMHFTPEGFIVDKIDADMTSGMCAGHLNRGVRAGHAKRAIAPVERSRRERAEPSPGVEAAGCGACEARTNQAA